MTLRVLTSVADLRDYLSDQPQVALVPTMGNLHEGHLELVRTARQHAACVVVSIFVNPLQFGAGEDFEQYPRTLAADCNRLAGLADAVFAPSNAEMYPQPQTLRVMPPPIADDLCGAARPGHFAGVATVVLKLFNLVQPQVAVFGSKDYQQLHIIRQLVAQFNLPIRLIGVPTCRAADGLALSSRNQYLTAAERSEAMRLYQTLTEIRQALAAGERDFPKLERQAQAHLSEHGWQVDYVSIRAQTTLLPPDSDTAALVILAAARLGSTRLIDNLEATCPVRAL